MTKMFYFRKVILISLLLIFKCGVTIFATANEITEITFQAQGIRITGTVSDNSGVTIAGVTVMVSGTTIGTTTDGNGEYAITVPNEDAVLEFAFIGFQPRETIVGNRRIISVFLDEAAEEIGEVVVTAFGRQRRESVVSSIETVRISDLTIPSSNLTTALAGRVAGLISYQTSGEPGADNADFFVRGVTTFGYATAPLILIDGFEASRDALARLQPDDIESFSVMKDAAASVMYGARGANGIIIVTTKSGREGPARINFRFDVHAATPTRIKEVLDGPAFMRMYNEAYTTRSQEVHIEPFYSEQKIQATMRGENEMVYPNVDWYNKLFRPYTINTRTNLNISGGGRIATYYVSGGWDNENGLLKVDGANNFNNNITINRAHIRNNVMLRLGPTTRLDTRLQGRFDSYNGPHIAANEIFNSVMRINPVDFPAIYEPDASLIHAEHILFGNDFRPDGELMTNPYAEMVRGYRESHESRLRAQAALIQDLDFITEGLQVQLRASADTWNISSGTRQYYPFFYKLDSYNMVTGEHTLFLLNPDETRTRLGDVTPFNDSSGTFFFEARAHWERTFAEKHSVGTTFVGMMDNRLLTSGRNYSIFQTLPERNAGISGRLTYAYDLRYFLEAAFGYNGSEKFSEEKTFGFFPSIGLGWIVTNENFWTVNPNIISNLKLKFTLGKVGNDAIAGRAGRFFFLSEINEFGGTGYRFGESFASFHPAYSIIRYANADITWESSTKYNAGLEVGLFRGSVNIHVDGFFEERVQIYEERRNYPRSSGVEVDLYSNSGKVNSRGIDGSIDVQHYFTQHFWIQGRTNFTYATSKIIARDEPNYRDAYRSQLGHSTSQRWGLVAERLFVDEDEIRNSPRQFDGNYMAGDIKYKDINNDGVVNDEDQIPMGFPMTPEIQYGFGLSTGYKKFDFSFFFQGSARVAFFIDPGAGGSNGIAPFWDRRNALKVVADNYWSETNPDVHAFWPRLSTHEIANNRRQSSWWLRDGSFLRLRTVEMGYNFGSLPAIRLENARIYFSGENLFLVSRFKLWDPEQRENGLGYPLNRRFNLGIQISF